MSALGSTFSGRSVAFRAGPVQRAAAGARPVVQVEAKRVCQLTGRLGLASHAEGRRGWGRSQLQLNECGTARQAAARAAGGSASGRRQRERQAAARAAGGSASGRLLKRPRLGRGVRSAHAATSAAASAAPAAGVRGPHPVHPLASAGKKRNKANVVTFSNKHNRKWQEPNLQNKKVFWEEGQRWVKLRISTKAIKTIEKVGPAGGGPAGRGGGGGRSKASLPTRLGQVERREGTLPIQWLGGRSAGWAPTPSKPIVSPGGPQLHGQGGGHRPVEAAV
jgi:large subunit ribosomal protein L28